jgi:hypothetical protein
MTLSELRDKMNSVIADTIFSIVYESREDGFELLVLYQKTMSDAPKRPRMRTVQVGSIYKSKYDDGWVGEDDSITDDTDEDIDEEDDEIQADSDSKKTITIGNHPYMYKINGIPCGTIEDGLFLFLEPLAKAGLKIPGVSIRTPTEMLKESFDKKVRNFAVSTFITIGVIMSLIGIAFPPLLVCGIVFIVVGVLSSRAKTKVTKK